MIRFALLLLLFQVSPSKERGVELYRERRFAEAARALEQHLAAAPGDVQSRLLLGLAYQQADDLPRAEEALAEATRRAPRAATARYSLARVRYLRGKLAQAEVDAREAARLGEPAARVDVLLGLIHLERQNYEAALGAFGRAQQSAPPDFAEPWIQSGKLLAKLGRNREAVDALEEAVRRAPASAEARALLARARSAPALASAASPDARAIRFADVAAQSGIDFVLRNHATPEKYLVETMPGGVAAFDYDGDGLIDLYFTNGAAVPALAPKSPNELYRNLGGMKFSKVDAGVAGDGYSIGASAADFDSDGHVDLFVAGVRRNILYRNRGDGSFENVTRRAGISSEEWSVGGAWLDYDLDGRLDLFVVNYVQWDAKREPYCGDEAKHFRVYCHPKHYTATANTLYRNLGEGRFADVSSASGVAAHAGKGMSASVADYDRDGYPDVFVANDAMRNFLFRNKGDGTFEERAVEAGVALTEDGKAVSGMGSDFRDYDNDGLPDIVFTALPGETFPLFRNLGNGHFGDVTNPSKLGMASARRGGWGIGFADFDNDGWKDLFTANSHVMDNVETYSHEQYKQMNSVFQNLGGTFREPALNAATPRAHRGSAYADLDNDGRVDVVVTALGERIEVWRNVSETANHWVAYDLRSHRTALGAVVRIGSASNAFTSAVGYGSSSYVPVHLGVGKQQRLPEVRIEWPSGKVQTLLDVEVDRIIRVNEPR